MAKSKPRKPTESFAHIAFGKDGTVRKNMHTLSSEKETQELEAIHFFKEGLGKKSPGLFIQKIGKLPEYGHDFSLDTSNGHVTVQLTELVERAYARPLTAEEDGKCLYKEYIAKEYGAIPWGVDTEQRDAALYRAIEKKIERKYAKELGEQLWLVVFTTSTYYLVEYSEASVLRQSPALLMAREYLQKLQQPVFDEVWFTNLQTVPIRIWPL